MVLLLASTNAGRLVLTDASALVRHARELDTARSLSQVLSLLQAEVQPPLRRDLQIAAATVRAGFGLPSRPISPLLTWRRKLNHLQRVLGEKIDAELLKVVVPPDAARTLLDRLQAELLNPTDGKAWNGHVRTAAGALATTGQTCTEQWRRYAKADFLAPTEERFRPADIQQWARQIAWGTLQLAINDAIEILAIKPVSGAVGGELLLNLAAAIRAERWSGGTPVVLVPHGRRGHAVNQMHWQVEGRSAPPHGVEFGTRQGTEGPFANRTVNDALVYDMKTLDDGVYVVPLSWFDRLVFEQRPDGTVLQHELRVDEPDSVLLQLHWRAELSGAPDPR